MKLMNYLQMKIAYYKELSVVKNEHLIDASSNVKNELKERKKNGRESGGGYKGVKEFHSENLLLNKSNQIASREL